MTQSTSAAVLCTVLVAVLAAVHIPGSHAATSVTLSVGPSEKLMAKVTQMAKRGETVIEKSASKPRSDPNPSPQGVCDNDTSLPSSFMNVCKVFMQYPSGTYVCSGWVVSPNKVALAAHCVVDETGYASSVFVKCGDLQITVTNIAVPDEYYNYAYVQKLGRVHWSDGAVVRLRTSLPSTMVPWQFLDASCPSPTTKRRVTVAGYPAVNSGRCHYDGIMQWWSRGSLSCKQDSSGFYRTDIDSCGGGSGSVVYNTRNGKALGIFVAEMRHPDGLCAWNLVTRILDNAAGGVNSGKGVSIMKLIGQLPA